MLGQARTGKVRPRLCRQICRRIGGDSTDPSMESAVAGTVAEGRTAAQMIHISPLRSVRTGLTDASYFKAVYQEAVELTAYLCKEYNLDPLADGVDNLPSGGLPQRDRQ